MRQSRPLPLDDPHPDALPKIEPPPRPHQTTRDSQEMTPTAFIPKPFVVSYLIILTLIAIYIRVHHAGSYHYSSDEVQHVEITIGQSLADVIRYSRYETHPPLGYILRHYWMLGSQAVWYVRSFSLIFGIALIPLYYAIGRYLSGRFTGLCCATFSAFSFGGIIQSYVVRDYTVFLFFLSAGFYCFLRWRRSRALVDLMAYGGFCGLACLTHFSGIFAVFSIFVLEVAGIRRNETPNRNLPSWAMANFLVAVLATAAYYVWKDTLHNSLDVYSISKYYLLTGLLSFPVRALFYIYPSPALAIAVLLALPLGRRLNGPELDALCVLTLIALALGAVLFGVGVYPFAASRQSLWLFPFVIVTSGWLVSNMCLWSSDRVAITNVPPRLKVYGLSFLLLAIGWVSYQPAARFAERDEYTLTNHEWQNFSDYLASLDSRSLIVADRVDAFLIDPPGLNLYPQMASTYGGSIVPYRNTRLLFRTAYGDYRADSLLRLIEDVRKRHLLDGVERLVFVRANVTRSAIIFLTVCSPLDKKIIPFSDSLAGGPAVGQTLIDLPMSATVVSTMAYFTQLASPSGKAHPCVRGREI